MDFWRRLGTWQLYGRKCEMGILFCFTMLRGGFKLLSKQESGNEIKKTVFSLISCPLPPSPYPFHLGPPTPPFTIQLPSLLPSSLTIVSDTRLPAVSLISLQSPFPFPPAFGPRSSLLPSSSHLPRSRSDQGNSVAAAPPGEVSSSPSWPG